VQERFCNSDNISKEISMNRTKWIAALSSMSLFAAMTVSVAAGANGDKPAGPRSLPGDNLPPFNMLDDSGKLIPPPPPPPGGYHHGPKGQPESTAPGPTLEMAIAAARVAVDNCTARGYYGAATVVDSVGEARAMLSADGSDGSHVFVAQRKAITALEFKMPSADVRDAIARDPALLARVRPNMFVQFGAFPITSGGKVIGAIGYSGGDDVACAKAGWQDIQGKLGKASGAS
jgi:uncharacterized protein GlcG (DUF336 family)